MKKRRRTRYRICEVFALVGLISATSSVLSSKSASAQLVAPNWSYTGNLNTARQYHTATLLHTGKVLVVGGYGGNGSECCNYLRSAELYDPATGTWSRTGDLNGARDGQTATLLPTGKVLIVGGYDLQYLNSAELYDADTGTWSLTANLNTSRGFHTATLLPNGEVLVVGGYNNGSLDSAELYDPDTGRWSSTGNLKTGRENHSATLLLNGKVLVTGGYGNDDDPLSSAELYDPATGMWSGTGNLNRVRGWPTTILLPSGQVLTGDVYSDTEELYDPATESWSNTGNLSTERGAYTVTLLPSGKVLAFGGYGILTTELYDPASETWSLTANLNTSRGYHTATLLPNGKVLVAAGTENFSDHSTNTAELYDPGTASAANPIDDAQFFVRQHYHDFLNREPDLDGLAFWTNEITSCGADPQCIEVKRINVSAAFFLSIEFQNTGYLAERMYKAAYGDAADSSTGMTVPIVRRTELTADSALVGQGLVVNSPGWEQKLDANKQDYALAFVQRQRFIDAYPPDLAPDQFVAKLNLNTGNLLTQDETNALVAEASADTTAVGRANVLMKVAENSLFDSREKNRAFVLMQYFGYLRRDPDSTPDSNYSGYQFWLAKLDQFGGDFMQAEMVKAFITSAEYRQRFVPEN
jgi:hypothetical protein